MPLDTVVGPSLSDLMNQKAMQKMQIYGIGQEAQLRNLQVQSGQEQLNQQNQLRGLFQNMQPGQDLSSLLPELMKLGPQGIDAASKMSTSLVAMQQMKRMDAVRQRFADLQNSGAQPGMQPTPQNGMPQMQPMTGMAQQALPSLDNLASGGMTPQTGLNMPTNSMQPGGMPQAQQPAKWVGNPMMAQQGNPQSQNPMAQQQSQQPQNTNIPKQQMAQIFFENGMIDEGVKIMPKVKDWKPINDNGQVKYLPLFEDGTTGIPTTYQIAEKLKLVDSGNRAGVGINEYTGAQVSPGVLKGVSPDEAMKAATQARGQNMVENGKLKALAQGNKPPAGYRYTPDNNLEAIKGGPADLKLQGALNADTQALSGSTASMDRLAAASNEVLNHPGLKSIYGLRGTLPNVPGSQAADAGALLNTLKSQVGFGVLQDMRNNSKTGGALGAVSDKEGAMLQANLAALEKAQSVEQAQLSLKKIVAYTDAAKDRLRDAYNMKHNGGAKPVNTPAPNQPTTAPNSGIDNSAIAAELKRRGH